MKLAILALAALAHATTLAAPATAQRVIVRNITIIRTDSQDFFKQGREQFEREIRFVTLRSYLQPPECPHYNSERQRNV
jgi:hypothetical protein